MSALIRQVALVSDSTQVRRADVSKVAAALQKQVTRDVAPIWDVSATVDSFDSLEDVPPGYWPIIILDEVEGAAGIHEDKDGQPFALVTGGPLDVWSITASHECIEMLVDPFGNRTVAGDSPMEGQGRVSFLVEPCDPSEASDFGYSVNGIFVSDFYTPHFFDPLASAGVRYSFTGAINEPLQVLQGGYLSWKDPVSDHWWQEIFFDGDAPTFRDIGPIDQKANGNVRATIDRLTSQATAKAVARGRTEAKAAGTAAAVATATAARAAAWRRQIAQIRGQYSDGTNGAGSAAPRSARRL